MRNMGEITKRVIVELLLNSRRPISTISKTPYLTRDIVSYQMKRLEKDKIIKGYTAQIQQHYFAQGVAHVQCKLKNVSHKSVEESIIYLESHQRVNWIGSVCGNADIIFTFIYTSVVDMQEILSKIIRALKTKEHSLSLYTEELKFDRRGIFTQKPQLDSQVLPTFIQQQIALDAEDKMILRRLIQDARITNRTLAQETQLSEDAIRYRIKNLEKKGVITGYTTILDTNKLGFEGYIVYLHTEAEKGMMRTFVQKQPAVIYCAQMSGTYNYIITILVKNRIEFTQILQELRNTFSDTINSYDVMLLLDEHKEIYLPHRILEN